MSKKKAPVPEVPDFLKPVEPTVEKQKPGPKAGVLRVTSPCPYCGEAAHRKAVQNIKGVGPLRRMYCASGCGHYHYRDVQTNEVVEAGKGPRVSPLFKAPDADAVSLAELEAELKKARQALKRKESELRQAEKAVQAPAPERDWLFDLADTLGIDPGKLEFTSIVEGAPRVIARCMSDEDITKLDQGGREAVEKLHIVLLTTQACINAYKALAKSKGK